ncbi:MAG: CapA family protein [Clostridia bacterium]|nr:CapA family protein [Clostridia bacterium]
MNKKSKIQKLKRRRRFVVMALSLTLAVCIALVGVMIYGIKNIDLNQFFANSSISSNSSEIKPTEDLSQKLVATATVVNTGDIMLHNPVLDGAKTQSGGYDFSAFFTPVQSYFKNADLAVANFEVTLGGTEAGAYRGYPAFNAPDSLLDTIKNSGINFLLTSNNHCYDTGVSGFKRTITKLKENNIDFNGTRATETDPIYTVKDVNGIKLGMINFTYENTSEGDNKSINGVFVSNEVKNLINSFDYNKLEQFYAVAQSAINDMRQNGAEAIVFYMHWGEEYQTTQNTWQKTIAQKLCNMGVDVIVGGHPHVVQPIEMLYSEDSQNTTVCIYSLGNAISNQRQEVMTSCPSGHTEDGMLFYYTFQKYGDGTVVLSGIDIIPTWVNKYRGGSGFQYTMYPLEDINMATSYGLDSTAVQKAKNSFERTKKIVALGLTECQNALGCSVRFVQ